jgi:UDP-N-acetylglucosamine--N-acetylmuramyl-(pentapeptide) pyrophosphoryl-undecaprenol N-acetylglucosamine transferase
MRVLIIGGHLSPAISVIEKLTKDEVFYVGRKFPLEGDNAPSLESIEMERRGIPFFDISTGRLQRKFTRHTIPSLLKLPKALIASIGIISKVKPDVVLGFGGYVQFPIIMSAKLLKIPTVIHEQTFEAGLANRMLGKTVTRVCISWESSRTYFPQEKVVLTGLPIKKELEELKREKVKKNSRPLLYITGGSLGSHTINSLVSKTLKDLLSKFSIVHQTGDSQVYRDYESLVNLKNTLPETLSKYYVSRKFLTANEALSSMKKADIVVARSGVNTVVELLFLKKPSYLIPISYSQKDEQKKNAVFLQESGLAEIGDENSITPSEFKEKLFYMISNIDNYKIKETQKYEFDKAADKIIEVLKDVCKKEKV